jgi:Fe-S oxidoreductase
MLTSILGALRSEIERGTPLVGLEPSCVSVFRDELVNMLPGNLDAVRLREQSYLLSEFLEKIGWLPPSLKGKALVHGHCHHKAIAKLKDERAQLDKVGLDYEVTDSGCCGMAGAFGFERDHFDVSQACGERSLLPAVRGTSPGTLIITDGFSCREQIAQGTGRRAFHLAEVLQRALVAHRAQSTTPARPARRRRASRPARVLLGAAVLATMTVGVAAARRR